MSITMNMFNNNLEIELKEIENYFNDLNLSLTLEEKEEIKKLLIDLINSKDINEEEKKDIKRWIKLSFEFYKRYLKDKENYKLNEILNFINDFRKIKNDLDFLDIETILKFNFGYGGSLIFSIILRKELKNNK